MIVNKKTSIFFLVLAIFTILLLSLSPAFYSHLRVDFYGQYIDHAKTFLDNGNLSNLGYNEYQPVAVMFFVALSPFYSLSNSGIDQYVYGAYFANIILIIVAAFLIYAIRRDFTSLFVFGLVLLLTGPIVLNRFEMLVFVEILLSVFFFVRRRYAWSGFFMAVAILTKIYPVIFVPYMIYVMIKNRSDKKEILHYLVGGLSGAAAVIFIYCGILGADFWKILSDLGIHAIKPVHAESVWATLLTLFNWGFYGNHVIGGGAVGIYGLLEDFIVLPKWFFNYFWVIPIAIYYGFVFYKERFSKRVHLDLGVFYLLALLFLVTSKILTGQYLLWFSLLFCLVPIPDNSKKKAKWTIELFLILMVSVMTLYVYPLNYDALIAFYTDANGPELVFLILSMRNILLLVLLFFGWKHYPVQGHEKTAKIS